jgi:hypothetical protein
LDSNSNIQYIRSQALLRDKVLYSQSQQALWKDYFHVDTAEDGGGVWASQVQETISRQP